MDRVFLVQHVHELEDGSGDIKLVGVYASRERAEDAIQRLGQKPGFCDALSGFHIDEYRLDEDHWTEGYVSES